jgi:tetratricopeptide (TPR) repeat protein
MRPSAQAASHAAVQESEAQPLLGGMDIIVRRNAFGRQARSFETALEVEGFGDAKGRVDAVFIRAPWIEESGPGVEILARYGTPEFASIVRLSLRDPDGNVRRKAADALGQLKSSLAIAALWRYATGPDLDLAVSARQAVYLLAKKAEPVAEPTSEAQAAASLGRRWSALGGDAARARSASAAELAQCVRELSEECARLRAFVPDLPGDEANLGDLERALSSLAKDGDTVFQVPTVREHQAHLRAAGLQPLVDELRAEGVAARHFEARFDLAQLYHGAGQTQKAIGEYEQIVELSPLHREAPLDRKSVV